jgi:hypothetical protein
MLFLLDFFLFLFRKMHYRTCCSFPGEFLWKRQLTPPSTGAKLIVAVAEIIFCEERRGGVAAIEQPPETGNCSWRGTRRKMEVEERETAGKKLTITAFWRCSLI